MKSCCFRNCPEMCTLPHIVGQEALLNQVYLSETKHRFQNWPFYLLLHNLGAHSKTFVFVYVDIFEKTAQPFVCAVYPKHNKGIIRNKFMQKVYKLVARQGTIVKYFLPHNEHPTFLSKLIHIHRHNTRILLVPWFSYLSYHILLGFHYFDSCTYLLPADGDLGHPKPILFQLFQGTPQIS